MITYKQYFGNEIYEKIISNPETLKEIYKVYFNVEKVPLAYSQKIKNSLLKEVSRTSLFMAVENKQVIAIAQGSIVKNNFTLDHFSTRVGIDKSKIETKLISRAIGYLRVKKNIISFDSSYMLSEKTIASFKSVFNRTNKSKKINYLSEGLFSKNRFKAFKKTTIKRK
jgi:hypothetical protein